MPDTPAAFAHVPVLSNESIQLLNPRPGGVFIDATLGGAGHAALIAEAIAPGGRLLGLDRDPAAIARCGPRLRAFEGVDIVLRHSNFADLESVAVTAGFDAADGILFDFGLSSFQLDDPERGFAFRHDGPLDMRMDTTARESAKDLANGATERELAQLIRRYGEERWATRIAQFIVRRRPIRTTRDLVGAVEAAVPRGAWPRDIHPATRTFQAFRIAVNDELDGIERGLAAAIKILRPGGRMAAISFHSLEDRGVKRLFAAESTDCLCPPQQPICTCSHRATLRVLTRRPITATDEEIQRNPRARSARLRGAERVAVS